MRRRVRKSRQKEAAGAAELVHTAILNDLSPRCLRYRLLQYCLDPHVEGWGGVGSDLEELRLRATRGADRQDSRPPDPFDSWFEVDVFLQIANKGLRVIPQFRIAGYHIDLVVEGMEHRIAIECDGDRWHGAERYAEDMARQRQLERCGWTFWRIRGSQYYRNPESAVAPLWSLLERMGIAAEPAVQPFSAHMNESIQGCRTKVRLGDRRDVRPECGDADVAVDMLFPDFELGSSNCAQPRNESPTEATAIAPQFGIPKLHRAESISDDEVWDAISRFIPPSGKVKRSELLKQCAAWLDSPLNRHVRSRFNKSISAKIRTGILKVDEDWEDVWHR